MAVQRYTRLTADFQFRSRRGRTLHGTEQTHSQFMWPLDRITIDARTYSQKYKSIEFFAKCLQRTRARRGGDERSRAAPARPMPHLGICYPEHKSRRIAQSAARCVSAQDGAVQEVSRLKVPGRSQAAASAALEAARSSTRGSGWAPSGPVSPPGSAGLPRAARRPLRPPAA